MPKISVELTHSTDRFAWRLALVLLLSFVAPGAWAEYGTDNSTVPPTLNCSYQSPTSPVTINGNAPGAPGAIDADTVNLTVTLGNPQSLDGPVFTITANGADAGGLVTANNGGSITTLGGTRLWPAGAEHRRRRGRRGDHGRARPSHGPYRRGRVHRHRRAKLRQ